MINIEINRKIVANVAKKICNYTGIPSNFVKMIVFEIKLFTIRVYNLTPFFYFKIKKIQQSSQINLNFGSGQSIYKNWINVDCVFDNNTDLVMDLRRKIPLKSDSVDFCYSEHFLEHLYPGEGITHLKEVYRILKPGGVYRLVLPDAIKFARKYIENDITFFKKAHPWVDRPIDALLAIYNFGGAHKNIFDFGQIKFMAMEAGFNEVSVSTPGGSTFEILKIDNLDPQRVLESFYVELRK